jgi:hypothetical protein
MTSLQESLPRMSDICFRSTSSSAEEVPVRKPRADPEEAPAYRNENYVMTQMITLHGALWVHKPDIAVLNDHHGRATPNKIQWSLRDTL